MERLTRRVDGLLASGDDELRATAQALRAAADSVGAAGRLRNAEQVIFGPAADGPDRARGRDETGDDLSRSSPVAGCVSSAPRQADRYFLLEAPIAAAAPRSTGGVRDAPTSVSSFHDTQHIAYSTVPGTRVYYRYSHRTERPQQLVQAQCPEHAPAQHASRRLADIAAWVDAESLRAKSR